MHSENDVMALIESYEAQYGGYFTDEYDIDMALSDFKEYGYDYVIRNVLALADELDGENYLGLD